MTSGVNRLRLLLREELGDGHHRIFWDGTDEAGRPVAPGTYLYRVSVAADDGVVTRQGVLGVVYCGAPAC